MTDEPAVAALVARLRPDVVFNATAYNRVDAAESEPERAFAVNALAPRALALAARELGALLVHVSTDYVFDGALARPYREDDPAHPLSVYGASKLAGEGHVLASGAEALVVRTSGVLGRGGSAQKGGSFIDRILAQARAGKPLRVVADQRFAPTSAGDLAGALVELVRLGARGLCHVTNAGLVLVARARHGRARGGRSRAARRGDRGCRAAAARAAPGLLRARQLARPSARPAAAAALEGRARRARGLSRQLCSPCDAGDSGVLAPFDRASRDGHPRARQAAGHG